MAGAPTDISHKNNTHKPGISIHYFPKDVAVWPKWTRFDRRHREYYFLRCHWPLLRTGFEDACYEHIPLIKSGEENPWIQLKRILIKGPVPTRYMIVQYSFRLTCRKRIIVNSLLFISRAWDQLILLVFPHDYIRSFHSLHRFRHRKQNTNAAN